MGFEIHFHSFDHYWVDRHLAWEFQPVTPCRIGFHTGLTCPEGSFGSHSHRVHWEADGPEAHHNWEGVQVCPPDRHSGHKGMEHHCRWGSHKGLSWDLSKGQGCSLRVARSRMGWDPWVGLAAGPIAAFWATAIPRPDPGAAVAGGQS